ncbi:hypothetical protein [Brevibacillus dissolubilis]|nr:hypothetical protein [Brevibacillus dissolubilis]
MMAAWIGEVLLYGVGLPLFMFQSIEMVNGLVTSLGDIAQISYRR